MAAADPDNAGHQCDLSLSHNKLGELATARDDTTAAEQHYRTGLGIAQRLGRRQPDNAQSRNDLAYVRERLASLTEPDTAR